nr:MULTISPECIES: alpha/beta fold hydrolase [unclassified Variovorax]
MRGGEAPSRQAIVFVHGNPGSSKDWISLLREVQTLSRAIAPDMPGFGQADKPGDFDYSVAGYARHLDMLLVAEGIERVHLVLTILVVFGASNGRRNTLEGSPA